MLTWSGAAGSSGYNVFLGTTNPPSFMTSTSGTTYTPPPLLPGTTYYWTVATWGTTQPTGRSVHFVAITDYGTNDADELNVANLAKSQTPDFIVTFGDNNTYEGNDGNAASIDANIGQYYSGFIYPYAGGYGPGASTNMFWPALGNHDWDTDQGAAYLSYFTLPGNERYYDYVAGPVHFFVLNSNDTEPDGATDASIQAAWLKAGLAAASEPWKIVYFHHGPYSSGAVHGDTAYMQWPFQQWGADAVFSGHNHVYERVMINGFPYITNGSGGQALYDFGSPVAGSVARLSGRHGDMVIDATDTTLSTRFVTVDGVVFDPFTLTKSISPGSTPVWSFTTAPAPLPAPTQMTPAQGATVAAPATLTWSPVAGSAGYVVYFGTSNPPRTAYTVNGTSFTPTAQLVPGTVYYWFVASRDPNYGNQEAASPVRWLMTAALPGFSYHRTITLDHTKVPNTDQTNFPILFSVSDALLKSSANGGHVSSATGYDIVFTEDAAGTEKLDHEIESYNDATGQLVAWIRVPLLSHTTDTLIHMWYGNATIASSQESAGGVWDATFTAVYHMGDNAASTVVRDSTARHSGANQVNTNLRAAAGEVDGALTFNGSADYVRIGDAADLQIGNVRTVSMWVKPSSLAGTTTYRLASEYADGNNNWSVVAESSGNADASTVRAEVDALGVASQIKAPDNSIAAGAFYHLAFVFGPSAPSAIYVNGVPVTLQTPKQGLLTKGSANILSIGARNDGARAFPGIIDEVRISSAARSADWIRTEYDNQLSPSSFYALSGESGGTVPVVIAPSAVSLRGGQTQTFTTNVPVTWSTPSAGSFNASTGVYTAPASIVAAQTVYLIATSVVDPTQSATATITLTPTIAVSITPSAVSLRGGQTQTFTTNVPVTWSTPSAGSFNASTGVYTAPASIATTQAVYLIATSTADSTQSATATITLTPTTPPPSNGYAYRRTITIDHTRAGSSDLVNFPLLLNITDPLLRPVVNGGHVNSAAGYDIIVTSDAAGMQKLDHQVESYNPNAGQIVAWVRIPVLSHTSDTVVNLFYGNPGIAGSQENKNGVWDGTFDAVYHMSDNAANNTVADSTLHHSGSNQANTNANAAAGVAAGALSFNGSTDYVAVPDAADLQASRVRTVSFWMKPGDLSGATTYRVLSEYSDSDNSWAVVAETAGNADSNTVRADAKVAGVESHLKIADNSIHAGTFYHVAAVFDNSKPAAIYLNGVSLPLLTPKQGGLTNGSTVRMTVGARADGGRAFPGIIDEVRISNTVRSADWVRAEFNNQSAPATFISLGNESP